MENFFSSLIRLIIFILIIRSIFFKSKKKNKLKTNLSNNNILETEIKTKYSVQEKNDDLLSEFEKELEYDLELPQEKNEFEKSEIQIQKSILKQIEIEQKKNKTNYQKFDSKNNKSVKKRMEKKSKENLISKNNFKKNVVQGIIFKEILDKPRSKKIFEPRI